ncbi:MAG: FAD-dependent oxidoreductase, partial [Synechococcales cyanobacterium CRU_2_2]|nr:FAD-dependent oxidoreductase [Synechococcales cyanobacterium CRU_2_2]
MTPIVLRSGDLNHNELDTALDIAIIGAGVAGLTCARQLQLAGYRVALIDKSRGLGGRLATRRLSGETHADHGVCYLQPKHPAFTELLQELAQSGILSVWPARRYGLSAEGALIPESKPKGNTISVPCYASETGITALAKALAVGLRVERGNGDRLELDTRSTSAGWR